MQRIKSLRAEQSRAEQSRAEQLDVCRIGNLNGFDGGSFAGQVYSKDGIAPTLTDMQGGGRQPHIVEVKKMDKVNAIGNLYPENPHQSGNVYDTNGVANTIMSGTHGYGIGFLCEQQIVAMRGRDKDNPSDRTVGNKNLEQRLEPNSQGISNTITSVEKDNLVLERRSIQVGDFVGILETESVDGLRMVRTEEGKALRKQYENGEIHHGFNEYREPEIKTDGISNTISTVQKDTEVLETKKIKIRQATKDGFIDCELPGVADLNYPSSNTRRGRVVEGGRISPTLTTENIPSVIELGNPDFYNFLYEIDGEIYLIRIRKLIPRECLRLMDVDEDIIDRMEKVESNTNLYKAAGNSITVNCLCAIFSQMGIQNVPIWNQLSVEERRKLIERKTNSH